MMGLSADVEERRGKVEEEFSLLFSFGLFFRASWLSTTKAYLSFCRMMELGVYLLHLDW